MEKRFLFILVMVICGKIFAGALGVIHDRKDGAFVFETDAKKVQFYHADGSLSVNRLNFDSVISECTVRTFFENTSGGFFCFGEGRRATVFFADESNEPVPFFYECKSDINKILPFYFENGTLGFVCFTDIFIEEVFVNTNDKSISAKKIFEVSKKYKKICESDLSRFSDVGKGTVTLLDKSGRYAVLSVFRNGSEVNSAVVEENLFNQPRVSAVYTSEKILVCVNESGLGTKIFDCPAYETKCVFSSETNLPLKSFSGTAVNDNPLFCLVYDNGADSMEVFLGNENNQVFCGTDLHSAVFLPYNKNENYFIADYGTETEIIPVTYSDSWKAKESVCFENCSYISLFEHDGLGAAFYDRNADTIKCIFLDETKLKQTYELLCSESLKTFMNESLENKTVNAQMFFSYSEQALINLSGNMLALDFDDGHADFSVSDSFCVSSLVNGSCFCVLKDEDGLNVKKYCSSNFKSIDEGK